MLLSISNSNYKAKVLWLLTSTLMLYVIINLVAFQCWMAQRAKWEANSIYMEDTQGQADLMLKKYVSQTPDIIFVGNSTTKMHINSNIFKENKLNIFNYSLLGFSLTQYPTMVENAIKAKPKVIVISIDKPELYYPVDYFYNSYSHADINFFNLMYLAKYLQQKPGHIVLSKLFFDYLLQKNYFKHYGYLLTQTIDTQFNKFAIGKKSLPEKVSYLCADKFNSIDYESCNNGDAIIDTPTPNLSSVEYGMLVKHSSDSFNYTMAAMLNGLIAKIRQAGIQPIIVFIPQFRHHVIEHEKLIAINLQARVIDMSDLSIPFDGWRDTEHMNTKGKNIYSKKLAAVLGSTVNNNQELV